MTEREAFFPNSATVWFASTLTLNRNLAHFPFPHVMRGFQREKVASLLQNGFQALKEVSFPCFRASVEVPVSERERLFESFLSPHGAYEALSHAAIGVDVHKRWLALFNTQNHLIVHHISVGGDLEQGLQTLMRMERELGLLVPFAHSSRFGFLTAALESVGTGLHIHAYLHLPALHQTKLLPKILETHKDEEVSIRAWKGELTNPMGDIFLLFNTYALGMSEGVICQEVASCAKRLVAAEESMRRTLRENKPAPLKDQISKAFGLLSHAYQLSLTEAFDGWSLVQLGLALGWIQEISPLEMSSLCTAMQRGHILCSCCEQPLGCEQQQQNETMAIDERRAVLIRKAFSQGSWTFP
jgi:protein arginine kinase